MGCPTCGWLEEGKAGICPDCGAEVLKLGAAPACPHCRARVTRGAVLCPSCGQRLRGGLLPSRHRLLWVLMAVGWVGAVGLAVALLISPDGGTWSLPGLSLLRGGRGAAATATPARQPSPAPTRTPAATAAVTASATLAPTRTPTSPLTATPMPTSAPTLAATPEPVIYTVQKGDVLAVIARRYGVSVEALVQANNLRSADNLQIGQELIIPGQGAGPAAEPAATKAPVVAPAVYVVKAGDMLSGIAERHGVTVAALVAENGLRDADMLRIGQELRIPGGTPPAPTPAPTEPPTATPAPTLTLTPQPTATAGLPAATPAAQSGATTAFPFPAPALLTPGDGATVLGPEDVLLNWSSVGLLDGDEWYLVRVWRDDPAQPAPPLGWTRATSWRLPASFRPAAGAISRRFWWSVTVMRRQEGEAPVAQSPLSQVRSFDWQ